MRQGVPISDQLVTPTDIDESVSCVRFEVPAGKAAILTLVAISDENVFTVDLFDKDDRIIRGSARAASQQQLLLPADAQPGTYLRVRREDRNDRSADSGRFAIRLDPYNPRTIGGKRLLNGVSDTDALETFDSGYAFREQYSLDDYRCMVAFASLGSANQCREGAAAAADLNTKLRRAIGLDPCENDCERQPLIVFFGIGGADHVFLLSKRKGRMRDLQRVSLDAAEDFWAVFIEDDAAPYETSIDVEFRERASNVDFEEFNPAATQPRLPVSLLQDVKRAQTMAAGGRIVRIGVRRFFVDHRPITADVAFTRQGAGYGLRQWRRVYRAFSGGWPTLAGSLIVPGRDVSVTRYNRVNVIPSNNGAPTVGTLTGEKSRYPVFASLVISIDQWRAHAFGEGAWVELVHPDIQLGLGLPGDRWRALFAGGSWPLAVRPLRFSAGLLWRRDQFLSSGVYEGQAVPLDSPYQDYSYKKWKTGFLIGVSVDLVSTR